MSGVEMAAELRLVAAALRAMPRANTGLTLCPACRAQRQVSSRWLTHAVG